MSLVNNGIVMYNVINSCSCRNYDQRRFLQRISTGVKI